MAAYSLFYTGCMAREIDLTSFLVFLFPFLMLFLIVFSAYIVLHGKIALAEFKFLYLQILYL